jgi:hypothetical protein
MYGNENENFRDLSTHADCDTGKSIDAASKLVCRLYDQKGKLKEDHVDLNSFASTNKVLQKIRRHLAFEMNWN